MSILNPRGARWLLLASSVWFTQCAADSEPGPEEAVESEAELDARSVTNCDVIIVGGSASGVAAAYAATRLHKQTCLIEEGEWLGGQLLTVPLLDGIAIGYHPQ